MHRVFSLALIVAGVLSLLLGTLIWDKQRASRACEDYMAALAPPGNLEQFRQETAWAWRKLEWECVFTGRRTGRVQRIDIDDTP